jgi:hypothetical protein
MMKKIIVLLLACSLVAGALVAAGCGGGTSSDSGDPKATVEQFMKATFAEDADATYELLSSESKAGVENKEELVKGASDQLGDWSVGAVTEEGDTARVKVTLTMKEAAAELTFDVVLVKEDGSWKVSLEETGKSMDEAFNKLQESSSPQ